MGRTNVSHTTILRTLLEFDAKGFEAITSLLDVVDGDGNVPEATARVLVATAVAEVGIVLSAAIRGFQV